MSRLLHGRCEGHSRIISSAKSSYIPRNEKVYTQCCNTEVPLLRAPRTSQLMSGQQYELFVGLVVSEMLLSDASQHNPQLYKRVRPYDGKANLGSTVPNESIRLRNPSTRSNKQIVATFRDKTNQDKSTNGCVKPMLTLSESTLIKLRCVRLKAPCRSPPRHSTSDRGERTSSDNIEVCATWTFACTRGARNT